MPTVSTPEGAINANVKLVIKLIAMTVLKDPVHGWSPELRTFLDILVTIGKSVKPSQRACLQ